MREKTNIYNHYDSQEFSARTQTQMSNYAIIRSILFNRPISFIIFLLTIYYYRLRLQNKNSAKTKLRKAKAVNNIVLLFQLSSSST